MATYTPEEPTWVTAWTGGRRKLGRDEVLGPWVKKIGTIKLVDMSDGGEPFFYLARTICYQQLAGKAAQTERAMERLEVVEQPREGWELRFDIPAAGRSGDIDGIEAQ